METLRVERDGPVAWLLFDRPAARNAMNVTMRSELPDAWRLLDRDPDVRVIVCSGAGPHFSSGVDLKDLADADLAPLFRRDIEQPDTITFTTRNCGVTKPVIAAVNGQCVGGAFMWVVDADFAVAASDAQFIDPHTSIGQTVGRGTIGLTSSIPFGDAMRLALGGSHERMSAGRALEVGLVTEVVDPPERLREVVQEIAERIARNSPAALACSKRAMWRSLQLGLDEACRAASADIVEMWSHPDQEEGPAAFAEKRPANWAPLRSRE
jgi:enoyl-CoA hydratase